MAIAENGADGKMIPRSMHGLKVSKSSRAGEVRRSAGPVPGEGVSVWRVDLVRNTRPVEDVLSRLIGCRSN